MASVHGPLWLGLLLLLVGSVQAFTTWDTHRHFLRDARLHSATITEVELVKFSGRRGREVIEHWILFEFVTPDGMHAGGKLPDDRKIYQVGDTVEVYWHPQTFECRYKAVRTQPRLGLALLALGVMLLGYRFLAARFHGTPAEREP